MEFRWLRPLLKAGLRVDNVCHASGDLADADGLTPLVFAAHRADPRACAFEMQLLIKHGADVNAVDHRDGNTYMHKLVQLGRAWMIQLMFEAIGSRAAGFGQLNHAKQSIGDLATQLHLSKPQDKDAASISRHVERFYQVWQRELEAIYPIVEPIMLSTTPLLAALASIVRQYLDGSGKPFESAESAAAAEAAEDAEMKGTESAAAAAAEDAEVKEQPAKEPH